MDKIVVTSPNMAKYSTALKGRQNINIIPLGVDTEHFSCNGEDARKKIIEALPEYSFIENIKMILFVGRIARYKGIRELIDAVERLPENYCLSIVTNDSVEELKKIISSKKMDKKVVFFNKISYSKLPEFYRSADVFCMPSTDRGEAFGLVALEAMACGTPIITTELGTGTSFHNINGVTGRIIEPKNVVQLKDSIIDICENRINYDKQVIRKRAEEFSIENFRNEWSKLL
jgi:glycosyltransferase involved in cell wall biosynthesis